MGVLQRTNKKELPITLQDVRCLPVENVGVPYDIFMVLSQHSIYKTRMAVRHADGSARRVREHFIESVAYIREGYCTQPKRPDWLPLIVWLYG